MAIWFLFHQVYKPRKWNLIQVCTKFLIKIRPNKGNHSFLQTLRNQKIRVQDDTFMKYIRNCFNALANLQF